MSKAVGHNPHIDLSKPLSFTIEPQCFFRIRSFTKMIDVRPSTTDLNTLKTDHTIVYFNSKNPQELVECKVLFTQTFPSFKLFCDNQSEIGKLYPGISSPSDAQHLFDSINGPAEEVVAIHFKTLVASDLLTPPLVNPFDKNIDPKEAWIVVKRPQYLPPDANYQLSSSTLQSKTDSTSALDPIAASNSASTDQRPIPPRVKPKPPQLKLKPTSLDPSTQRPSLPLSSKDIPKITQPEDV